MMAPRLTTQTETDMTSYRYGSLNGTSTRDLNGLSDDTIRRFAPSVFADAPHHTRGESYAFIPTATVLSAMRAQGFLPVEARQSKVRDQSKREHTKHMLRFQQPNARRGDEYPEIVLVNSHDGASAYHLLAGVFRMVCSNGLIAGDMFNTLRVRHTGNVVDDVIEGSFEVISQTDQALDVIDRWRAITLTEGETIAFAQRARELRWGADEGVLKASSLVEPRRWADKGYSLWNVFNRAQEGLIRGGQRAHSNSYRRMRTRAVTGIGEDVRINRGLWNLAALMEQAKLGVAA
jgi:hypothetical protein